MSRTRKTPRTPLGDRLRTFAAGYQASGQTERAEGLVQGADAVDEFFESQKLATDDPMGALREAATLITEAAADLASAAMMVGKPAPSTEPRARAPRTLPDLLEDVPAPMKHPGIRTYTAQAGANGAAVRAVVNRDVKPGKGEMVVLTAVAQHPEGVTKSQLTVLCGYKRSSRDTYLHKLFARDAITRITGGRIAVTRAGRTEIGPDFKRLPTGPDLAAHWRERLPAGENNIFGCLVRDDGEPLNGGRATRDQLTMWTGYKRSSRDTYIQKLRARELVRVEGGDVVLSEHLR